MIRHLLVGLSLAIAVHGNAVASSDMFKGTKAVQYKYNEYRVYGVDIQPAEHWVRACGNAHSPCGKGRCTVYIRQSRSIPWLNQREALRDRH